MSLLKQAVILFFFSCVSWPLSSARTAVTHLPSFDGQLPFSLETGYVEVDEVNKGELFYYFVKSETSPETDPLLLWHSGGPGCSAFSAFTTEIGPLRIDVAAYNEGLRYMVYNPYTWTKMSNVIFVDSPIGTGFSYSETSEGYLLSDTKAALQLYTFLQKWLIDHPEFSTNPLFVGGDSRAGVIVPLVVQEIIDGSHGGKKMTINLKGYLTGNSPVDTRFDTSHIPFAHGMGLISDEIYESAKQHCDGKYYPPKTEACEKSLQIATECLIYLDFEHILLRASYNLRPHELRVRSMEEHHGRLQDPVEYPLPLDCRVSKYLVLQQWADIDAAREALGVRKGTVGGWERCSSVMPFHYTSDISSTLELFRNLTTNSAEYRALVYSGDHDLEVPFVGTQAWIRSLNYSIIHNWHAWFGDDQVGGYATAYSNNLTFATIRGGGHTAPEYRPKECQAMFARWVSCKQNQV